jgi:methyltransferase (TIGR00027 family)
MAVHGDHTHALPGVGVTALVAAAARAVETNRPDGLVTDPYAEAFVRHAPHETPMPTRLDRVTEDSSEFDQLWDTTALAVGVRSVFFDSYFTDQCARGVRQVVLLAAGLDTRAFRLPWPSGTVVFELDTAPVLKFKNDVLAACAARPRCDRRVVAGDLRGSWAAALAADGFDATTATAWLAEGILPYLSTSDERRLLDTIHHMSADISAIAFDHVLDADALRNDARRGKSQYDFDLEDMFATERGDNPASYLRDAGWAVSGVTGNDLVGRSGRVPGAHIRRALADKSRFEIAYLR